MLTAQQAARLNQAYRLLQSGAAHEALPLAEAVCAAAPKAADAHHLLALCRQAARRPLEAEKAFRRALKLAPGDSAIARNFAGFLASAGRHEEAARAWRRLVDAAPGDAGLRLNLGLALLNAGRTQDALRAMEKATELDPRSSPAWQGLGNARRAAGDFEGAQAAFRRSVAAAPDNAASWINLGVVLRLVGRPGEALDCFERARAAGFSGPQLADAEIGALIDLGEIETALDRTRALTRAAPAYVAGHATLAELLWEHGEEAAGGEDPFTAFRAAVAAQPANEALAVRFARFLLGAGGAEEALALAARLRRRNESPFLACLEADALEKLGRSEAAGALYAGADKALGAKDPAFLNAYARHLLKAGAPDAAAARAEAATRLAPDNQEAWAYLSTAWRLLGDPREDWLCDYDNAVALVEVEPPAGFADLPSFLRALKAVIDPMHKARREPVNQTLRGGSQTAGRLLGRPDPVLAAAHDAFVRAAERHVAGLPSDPGHPFYSRKARSVRIGGSWSVKLRAAGRHVNHVHNEGWMSSAFYLSLPPSMAQADDEAGWIQFGQPPADLDLGLAPRRLIRPREGAVALFPSYMWHGTVPFEDDAPRVTVAFDMTSTD